MARVLAISSHVVRGHVGLAASVPALQWLGHEVWALPTVLLASRPGLGRLVRREMPAADLAAMLSALESDGCWAALDAVLAGYFPSPRAVTVAAEAIRRIGQTKPGIPVLVDPILGDAGRLYVAQETAEAIRRELVPLATIATPNRFELQWLTGGPIAGARRPDERRAPPRTRDRGRDIGRRGARYRLNPARDTGGCRGTPVAAPGRHSQRRRRPVRRPLPRSPSGRVPFSRRPRRRPGGPRSRAGGEHAPARARPRGVGRQQRRDGLTALHAQFGDAEFSPEPADVIGRKRITGVVSLPGLVLQILDQSRETAIEGAIECVGEPDAREEMGADLQAAPVPNGVGEAVRIEAHADLLGQVMHPPLRP